MKFSSINTISPLAFYFASIICFVLANVLREQQSLAFYYVFLLVGIILFFLGMRNRIKSKK